MKCFAFVVVYNAECGESAACRTMPADGSVAVCVLDNSTAANGNALYCEGRGWRYLPMGGNLGLSRAYNRALDGLRGEEGIVTWFDDDTRVCPGFFEILRSHAARNPSADIFLPVVRDGDALLSPSRMGRFRSFPVKALSDLREGEITGINTGMSVRLGAYGDYRYDENLFLDCVDHKFIRDMKKARRTVAVMEDAVLEQRFFATQGGVPWEAVKRRFNLFKKDFLYFCGGTVAGRLYAGTYLAARFVYLYVKHALRRRGNVRAAA